MVATPRPYVGPAPVGDSDIATVKTVNDAIAAAAGWHTVSNTVLGADAATVNLSIVSTWSKFKVTIVGRAINTGAATVNVRATINNDSSSVYSTNTGAAAAFFTLGTFTGALTNTDRSGIIEAEFFPKASAWTTGMTRSLPISSTGTTGVAPVTAGLAYMATTAPASIQLSANATQFAAGTRFILEAFV